MSPESREKISRALRGRLPSAEHREKILQVRKAHPASPEQRERHRQARLRRRFPPTDIERILDAEFKKRRLRFEMHESMFGRFQPDFTFHEAKLFVQADGGWWHKRPKDRARDAAFNETAGAEGWAVWRFSDKQIKSDPAAIGRAVARFVRDHH